jgi:acyl carrier protein phosphodiesterase
MISDYVKGKKQFDYPDDIRKGITLHRLIDNFTDAHEAVQEAKKIFRADYRLYSGAVVDVVFDHFLATDETEFSEHSLFEFSMEVYAVLEQQQEWFPERFGNMFPHMKNHNWLFNYRTRWGAGRSLTGLVHRSKYLSEADTAFRLFEEHYQQLGDCYRYFWSFAKPFARHRFDEFMGDQATGIV